uniref:Uncharacterized protein n=1 Tax=Cacopsylla melanoneura TaxID=428564 RepID=A0A8D8X2Z0_9HEMI
MKRRMWCLSLIFIPSPLIPAQRSRSQSFLFRLRGCESLRQSCPRFGSAGWSKIPFLEAQKEIHAGGVFSRLKVNPEIDCRPSAEAELLANMDGTFGVLSHGLLLQRKFLADSINEVILKHPSAAADLRKTLSSADSPFRKTSDSLLQFVCGKRSDIILKRRKGHETATRGSPRFFKEIPPAGICLSPKPWRSR